MGSYDAAVILDGHNDLVLQSWLGKPSRHLDLEAARAAGFSGGFFALYIPSPGQAFPDEVPFALPLPDPIPYEDAAAIAEQLYATFCELPVRRARTVDDFVEGEVTAILHIEGAEAIAPDLSNLELWYDRGLRSVGPPATLVGAVGSTDSSPGATPAAFNADKALSRSSAGWAFGDRAGGSGCSIAFGGEGFWQLGLRAVVAYCPGGSH